RRTVAQAPASDAALASRVDRALGWLLDDGATASDALRTLLVALESDAPGALVVDLVEHRLDPSTQEALGAYLRQRATRGARPVFVTTRSSAVVDLGAWGPAESMIYCPANHATPMYVAPYAGAAGYEAVATCLASPEVRARTEGVIAWRPPTAT
ncbi:MAG: MerR family transcriptional regulator, partial [Solirubrobacteraceae bacterium]